MSQKMYRQGDLFLVEVEDAVDLSKAKAIEPDGKDFILAYGEVTGHAHRIRQVPSAAFFQFPVTGERVLVLDKPATITHEEHGAIKLPKGTFKVVIQREYSPEAIRSVID